MAAGNVPQLVSAVVAHALRQHEDSEWNTVVEGYRREDIATIVTKYDAKTPKQAIRAMRDHLASLRQPALV